MLGDEAMRWREANGAEDTYAKGVGTTQRSADGKVKTDANVRMVPTEIFRARGLLAKAKQAGGGVQLDTDDSRHAYVLRWTEHLNAVTINHAMWVDKDTYAPLRFTDRDTAASIPHPARRLEAQGPARPDLHRGHRRVQDAPRHAREPSAADAEVALDGEGALAALGDRGDDQRLAAARVPAGEDAVGGRVVLGDDRPVDPRAERFGQLALRPR